MYTYWDRRGFKSFPYVNLIFGHFSSVLKQKESFVNLIRRIYRETKEPFIGIYGYFQPILLICDPNVAQTILMKDFKHFSDRMYANLFVIIYV